MLSYKYIKRLFHHVYTFSTFKLTEENANLMVRIAPKLLTRIFDLQSKFLPKFSQAIREITRNINFVEKEMQTEDIMLAEELEYRRYIIYLAAKDGKGELNEFVIRKLTMVRSPHLSPWCLFRSNCGGCRRRRWRRPPSSWTQRMAHLPPAHRSRASRASTSSCFVRFPYLIFHQCEPVRD